jgi:hypothetical protein
MATVSEPRINRSAVINRFARRQGIAAVLAFRGEGRHECGGQGALGKQIPKQVRHAKGGDERVRDRSGAEEVGLDLVAHEPQHAAQ